MTVAFITYNKYMESEPFEINTFNLKSNYKYVTKEEFKDNRKKIETILSDLEKNEDNNKMERSVRHYIYFDNTTNQDSFITSIYGKGFTSEKIDNNGVMVSKFIPIDKNVLDKDSLYLMNQANLFSGKYDKLVTDVVKQEKE